MTVNAGPEYFSAEKRYFASKSSEEQILWLEEMIRMAPKHKSSENFVANLKQRLKKLRKKQEKTKSSGKTTFKAIRKEGFQCVLIGLPSPGKSSLLSALTNAKPKISPYGFTTKVPEVGTMDYNGVKAQIVDLPSIGAETFDIGIINTADLILIIIEKIQDLEDILPLLSKSYGKRLIVINKSDLLSSEEFRRLQEKINSRRLDALLISAITGQGIQELKEKIFKKMSVIRIYTKEPGKRHSNIPIVLPENSIVRDVAEKILKGFSIRIKETIITGPSSKFPNQKVGLSHILKDKDIVEFHTK